MATVSKHGRFPNKDVTWENDGHGDALISSVQCVFGQVERGHSSDSQAKQGMGQVWTRVSTMLKTSNTKTVLHAGDMGRLIFE